jgi:hypothetical protein
MSPGSNGFSFFTSAARCGGTKPIVLSDRIVGTERWRRGTIRHSRGVGRRLARPRKAVWCRLGFAARRAKTPEGTTVAANHPGAARDSRRFMPRV